MRHCGSNERHNRKVDRQSSQRICDDRWNFVRHNRIGISRRNLRLLRIDEHRRIHSAAFYHDEHAANRRPSPQPPIGTISLWTYVANNITISAFHVGTLSLIERSSTKRCRSMLSINSVGRSLRGPTGPHRRMPSNLYWTSGPNVVALVARRGGTSRLDVT